MTVANALTEFKSLTGEGYKLRDWLTSYPFLLVAIDPYTSESSWILDTATRIFDHYSPADVRVGWICAADADDSKHFLGPLAEQYLTFSDPEKEICHSLEVTETPSLIHIRSDGFVQATQGWDPAQWKEITDRLTQILSWSKITLPGRNDPGAFEGISL